MATEKTGYSDKNIEKPFFLIRLLILPDQNQSYYYYYYPPSSPCGQYPWPKRWNIWLQSKECCVPPFPLPHRVGMEKVLVSSCDFQSRLRYPAIPRLLCVSTVSALGTLNPLPFSVVFFPHFVREFLFVNPAVESDWTNLERTEKHSDYSSAIYRTSWSVSQVESKPTENGREKRNGRNPSTVVDEVGHLRRYFSQRYPLPGTGWFVTYLRYTSFTTHSKREK